MKQMMGVNDLLQKMIVISGMTQRDTARLLGISDNQLSRLVSGERTITYKYAKGFERVFGIPALIWMIYQEYDYDCLLKKGQAAK